MPNENGPSTPQEMPTSAELAAAARNVVGVVPEAMVPAAGAVDLDAAARNLGLSGTLPTSETAPEPAGGVLPVPVGGGPSPEVSAATDAVRASREALAGPSQAPSTEGLIDSVPPAATEQTATTSTVVEAVPLPSTTTDSAETTTPAPEAVATPWPAPEAGYHFALGENNAETHAQAEKVAETASKLSVNYSSVNDLIPGSREADKRAYTAIRSGNDPLAGPPTRMIEVDKIPVASTLANNQNPKPSEPSTIASQGAEISAAGRLDSAIDDLYGPPAANTQGARSGPASVPQNPVYKHIEMTNTFGPANFNTPPKQ
jgi:hypothetical protein